MKIALASDVHLEFGPIELTNEDNADVLVLSGDILVDSDFDMYDRRQTELGYARARSERYHEFFQRNAEQFKDVIYVAGNHEHYHGDYKDTLLNLKRKLAYLPNVHVLDKEVRKIGDVTFIGGTLWTDMNKEDPLTLFHISKCMNDFRCVENSNRMVSFKARIPVDKPVGVSDEEWVNHPEFGRTREESRTRPAVFSPEDAVEDHKKMIGFIQSVIEGRNDEKFVVCGHHAPSKLSTKPRYQDDVLMNGGYSSDLTEYIIDHPQIKLWTHGHTHDPFDYMVGETRVVCNPRGYINYEDCASSFRLQYIEV